MFSKVSEHVFTDKKRVFLGDNPANTYPIKSGVVCSAVRELIPQ